MGDKWSSSAQYATVGNPVPWAYLTQNNGSIALNFKIPYYISAREKLAVIKSLTIIKEQLNIRCNECFAMFINRVFQLFVDIVNN